MEEPGNESALPGYRTGPASPSRRPRCKFGAREPLEEGIWQQSQRPNRTQGPCEISRDTCTSRGPDQDAPSQALLGQEHALGCTQQLSQPEPADTHGSESAAHPNPQETCSPPEPTKDLDPRSPSTPQHCHSWPQDTQWYPGSGQASLTPSRHLGEWRRSSEPETFAH